MIEPIKSIRDTKGVLHKFDVLSDVCERCGLKRRRKAVENRFMHFKTEYLVGGSWVHDPPPCAIQIRDKKLVSKYNMPLLKR